MIQRTLLLITISLACLSVKAQDYNYAHYTPADGLAGAVVYCMAQDHDGFMWFGTETGLSRFDGTRFRNFTAADGLPDNEVLRLFVDAENRIWIIPFKGSVCYFYKGVIRTPANDSLLRKINISDIRVSVLGNAAGEIGIMESKTLKIIKNNGDVELFDKLRDGPGIYCNLGLRDKNTFECIIRNHPAGINLFEYRNHELIKLKEIDSTFVNYINANSCYLSPDLEIMATNGLLNFYSPLTGQRSALPLENGFIKLDRLNDSLVALNFASLTKIYNVRRQTTEQYSFKGRNVNGTFEDREGNLWFSTLGQGLYRLPSKEFKRYRFSYEDIPLPVRALKKYGDTLYAGTDHFMLWEVNTNTGAISNFRFNKGISEGRITVIEKNNKGLFVAGDMILVRVIGHKKIKRLRTNSSWKSASLLPGKIVLAGNDALMPVNTDSMNFGQPYFYGRVTSVYHDAGKFFVGTLKGLYVLNNQQDTQFLGNLSGVLSSRISSISASDDGIVWIATHENGVAGYRKGKVVAIINEQTGLTSNICQSLFVNKNQLWVGTDKGLNKVNLSDPHYKVTRYSTADGLMSNIVNAIFVDSNIVYVGTPEGISYFDETRIFTRSMCKLKITGIRGGEGYWPYDTSGLQFKHSDNNIRFEFSGISFKSGKEIEYRYRLKGLSDRWLITHDNFIEYAGLSSGDYELELVAKNKFDVQSETIHIKFTISRLLWEETWFWILYAVSLALAMWILVNRRIKSVRKQEKLKTETAQKIADLEQMALKAQMNPHFIFNSLNSIQQYVIDKDILAANKFITDFSRLIRLTLDISSKPIITLKEEINYLSTYLRLEKIRYESKFNYRILVPENMDVNSTNIPPMILQPFIENSVRHGVRFRDDDEGMITVEFRRERNILTCIVEDNGVGRKASTQMKSRMAIEYQSKGMTLTARRIEMMNKNLDQPIYIDIRDVDEEQEANTGTRVTITISLSDIDQKPHTHG